MVDNELKEIDIKNRTYYYLDDATYTTGIDIRKIKFDEKSFENLSVESYLVQSICVLFFLKLVYKLKIMMKINI